MQKLRRTVFVCSRRQPKSKLPQILQHIVQFIKPRIPGCNPLTQDCQANNEICIPDPQGYGFVCVLDASGDMHPAGTPCEIANQCNAGNVCLNVDDYPHPDCQGSLGCCGPLCEFPGGQCPGEPAGLTCESWYEEGMAPPGYEDVGICIVAQ